MKNCFTRWGIVLTVISFLATLPLAAQNLRIAGDADTLFVCNANRQISLQASPAVYYRWTPAVIFDNPGSATPIARPTSSTWVFVEGLVNGTVERDSVFLSVVAPQINIAPLGIGDVCAGTPVTIVAQNNTHGQGITWEPRESIVNPVGARVIVRPNATTTYTATLQVGTCSVRASVTVNVKPPRVQISTPDTVEICVGTTTRLDASTNTGSAAGLSWSPNNGTLSSTNGFAVLATPRKSTTYIATFTNGGCIVKDSVFVRVDSLPADLSLQKDEDKDPYCQGEIVKLVSPIFDPSLYADITHKWFPNQGFETPDTLYNMVITTQDSVVLFRETRNHGCVDTQFVFIPVIQPKDITITPSDPILCPGEEVRLTASFEGEGDITWEPTDGLSCTTCKNPVARPLTTTNYTITVKEKGCPSTQSVVVTVLPQPPLGLNTTTTICRGDEIQLNFTAGEGVTYTWTTPSDPTFRSTNPLLRVRPLTTTTYNVVAQINECAPTNASITINVVQPADVTLPADRTICPGESVTLTADGTAPAGVQESFRWQFGNQTANTATVTANNIQQSTVFLLDYTYGPNCGTIRKTVRVDVTSVPRVTEFSFDPTTSTTEGVPLGNTISVTATISPANPTGVTYQWSANGKPVSGNGPTIQHAPTEDPTVYTLTIRTTSGCELSFNSPPIRVLQPAFDIPNAFTPDGDGVNDYFNVVSRGAIEIPTFVVFNRWGQVVYNNTDPTNGWDGRVNGKDAPSDVYVYNIVIRFPDGQEFVRRGDVTLLR